MHRAIPTLVLVAALVLPACSVNPATGKQQLNLVSEAQEIEMGRQADKEIVASMGLVDDPETSAYVERLGKQLAAASERPNLPWTFRVVDDPTVNAFALPGGFIYVTRGILTHLNSEAELVSVLGHEIGHVTARHSVNQMSKAQLAQIGMIGAMIAKPELQGLGNLAGTGLQLLFLKYGRDDERQADELGLRYMTAHQYDPREMAEVFRVLQAIGGGEGGGRMPGWLSTHPDPGNRAQFVQQAIAKGAAGTKVNRDAYLAQIDGMVFGEDPREGYFRGNAFIHPDMRFRLDLPPGWKTANSKQSVQAISERQDALVGLALAPGGSAQEAARKFFGQEGLQTANVGRQTVNGLPAVAGQFAARTEQGELRGMAAFVEYGGRVFQLMGYGPAQAWGAREGEVRAALGSFRPETDPSALDVQPMRVDIVRLDRAATVEGIASRYPSTVPVDRLALINQVQPGQTLAAGSLVKAIVK